MLSQIVGLACDATAAALQAGKPALFAVGLLEQGRAVLATSVEEIRSDILDLQTAYPEIAARYNTHRHELDGPHTRNISLREMDREEGFKYVGGDGRYIAGNKLDLLTADIRTFPGFEKFLLPPTEAEMLDAAISGPRWSL